MVRSVNTWKYCPESGWSPLTGDSGCRSVLLARMPQKSHASPCDFGCSPFMTVFIFHSLFMNLSKTNTNKEHPALEFERLSFISIPQKDLPDAGYKIIKIWYD